MRVLTVFPLQPKEQVPKEAKFQPFELKPCMNLASAPFRKPLSEEDKQQLSKRLLEQVGILQPCTQPRTQGLFGTGRPYKPWVRGCLVPREERAWVLGWEFCWSGPVYSNDRSNEDES